MLNTDLLWSRPDTHPILLEELEYRGWKPILTTTAFVEVESDSLAGGPDPLWIRSHWKQVERRSFQSISEAAKILRNEGKLWTPFFLNEKSRTGMIAEALNWRAPKPIAFGTQLPDGPVGGFALLDRNTLLFSKSIQPNIRSEEWLFLEDEAAPSRAYLKLWELFSRLRRFPLPGEKVCDFGASPGGWTSVLAGLGCEVWSYDKAPLAEEWMKHPRVHFQKKDIYKLKPADLPELDWFLSDVIAYPLDLFEFLLPWIESGKARNFVVTLKLKGQTDFQAIDRWLSVPGSRALHLQANKHELTWFLCP